MLIKPEQLEKEIKQNNPETIFLLFGEETYLLENSLKRIKKNFGETISGINFVTLYENNVENLVQEIETPAFGYEKKLIIIRDSKIFQRGGKGAEPLQEVKEIITMEKKFTSENFEAEVLKSEKPVLVDFYADWCGPCKMMAPAVEALANEQDEVTVGKLNVDFAPELARAYKVMSIPTLILFKNGEAVEKRIGVQSKAELEALIK